MKLKDILWVVVPLILLIGVAFLLPAVIQAKNMAPVWLGSYNYLYTSLSDILFLHSTLNTFALPLSIGFFVQLIIALAVKVSALKKYIIMLFSGVLVYVISALIFINAITFPFNTFTVLIFSLILFFASPLILTALLLRLISTHKHKNAILIFSGGVITILSIIKIICAALTLSDTAIIGASDFTVSLLIAINACRSALYFCIFGILLILTSLIFIFLSKICSKKL